MAMECYAKETLDGEELPIPTYPPGRGPDFESLRAEVNRGRLSRSAGAVPRRGRTRGRARARTRALPRGPKMLEEDCCGEKRTPDYKEEQRKRLKRIQNEIDTMAQDEAGSYLEIARKLEAPRVRYTADDGSLVSNDMFDYVRVGCRLCRKWVNMSNLRAHTRRLV